METSQTGRRMAWTGLAVWLALFALAPAWLVRAQQPQPAPTVTVAQAEATQPGVPPAAVPPSETLGWSFAFGVIVNEIMKRLKKSNLLPWMSQGTARANALVAAALAALAAAGIHTEFDQAAGSLLITGLTLTNVLHFGGEWLKQWAMQHFMYHATKEPY